MAILVPGTVKLDIAKLGRGYLIVLWIGTVVLSIAAIGGIVFDGSRATYVGAKGITVAVLLVAAFAHGATAWGAIRRQQWSYYASLAISLYWVFSAGHGLITEVGGPRWVYFLFLVPGAVALAWLVTPIARSQFSSVANKA